MYKRILVALDGSPASESVLPFVRTLSTRLKTPIELLHVVDPDAVPRKAKRSAPQPVPQATSPKGRPEDSYLGGGDLGALAQQASERYLAEVANAFAGGPVGVTITVGSGDPAEVIVNEAAQEAGTLLAMTTTGRSGVGRMLIGSVAGKVLQMTTTPLLLIRASENGREKREALIDQVIVPLDGSELSERALDTGTAIAKVLGVPVVLVRVVAPFENLYFSNPESIGGLDQLIAEAEDEAAAYVEAKVAQVRKAGVDNATGLVLHGFPASALLEATQQRPNGLVVMTTHGRSGIGRWFLGSVSDRVARGSGQPVLVIHP